MNKLRVSLADDHIVMHTGLRALLERQPNLEVIGECENGRETVELAASLRPNVVVMDIGMPMLNGIEAIPGSRSRALKDEPDGEDALTYPGNCRACPAVTVC